MRNPFKRLLADQSGNTLAIFAAALVPMTIMVGSGVDISITYMAQAKLQNACDAAVLAGRQSMDGNLWNTAAENEAERFFDFNFPDGTHGAENVVFDVDQDPADRAQIVGSASGTIPTSIMRMFGYDELDISAACDAKRDLGHNDVMLVLDVTGSMLDAPSNGGGTKIRRLREGAAGLFRALDNDENGSVTRFGMVSYSHTVNVAGSLANSDIRDEQSFVGLWRYYQWRRYRGWSLEYSSRKPSIGWQDDDTYIDNGSYYASPSFTNRNTSDKGFVRASDSSWGSRGSFRSSGGCIEERASITGSADPIEIRRSVSLADINRRASGDSEPELQFGRYDPSIQQRESQSGCPSPSIRLRTFTDEDDFEDNGIDRATANVTGGTYHDIGMIWGLRFLSRSGFFAADNPTEIDGVPVNQHIVFMTDGMLDTGDTLYSAHGIEKYQGRTQGSGSLEQRHIARFKSICTLAKSMGVTVWVIALDVTSTTDISTCATSEGHFYTSDGSDLEEVFQRIGQGIGNLRLTR